MLSVILTNDDFILTYFICFKDMQPKNFFIISWHFPKPETNKKMQTIIDKINLFMLTLPMHHIPPIIMEVQIKMSYNFSHIRLDSWNFDLDSFNTILVGASVGGTILDSVLSISSKVTRPLDPIIPLIGANSRESVALIPRKMFPAILLNSKIWKYLNH